MAEVSNINKAAAYEFSGWALWTTLILLVVYFVVKYNTDITIDPTSQFTTWTKFSANKFYLIVFIFISITAQVIQNYQNLNKTCNDNTSNFTASIYACIVPWLFIFLVMVVTLTVAPKTKYAFSTVLGVLVLNIYRKGFFDELYKKAMDQFNQNPTNLATSTRIATFYNDSTSFVDSVNYLSYKENIEKLKEFVILNDADENIIFKMGILKDVLGEFLWYLLTIIFVDGLTNYNVAKYKCLSPKYENT